MVSALGGRREALPSFVGLTSIREHGVGGRPTLVQNAETLAHVALVGRFGPAWFRRSAHRRSPGTMLLTVNRPGNRLVVEAVLGSSLRQATGLRPEEIVRRPGNPPRRLRGRVGLPRGLRRAPRLRGGRPAAWCNARCGGDRRAAPRSLPAGRGGGRRPLHGGSGSRAMRPVHRRSRRAGRRPGAARLRPAAALRAQRSILETCESGGGTRRVPPPRRGRALRQDGTKCL